MKVKLIILPHAGGASHAYQNLRRILDQQFDVYCHDLPGHGRRSSEALMTSMDAIQLDLAQKLELLLDQRWAIFGHSMGALLADALIRSRCAEGLSLPEVFFASGTAAPGGKAREKISQLPGPDFWDKVCRYGGTPDEALQSPEFKVYFEALLRSDFSAVESYCPKVLPYEVPLHVFYGQHDMSLAEAESWKGLTLATTHCHPFAGGHFFLFDHITEISEKIIRVVEDPRFALRKVS